MTSPHPHHPTGGTMTWRSIVTAGKIHEHEILATDYDSIEIIYWANPPRVGPGWFTRDGDSYFPALWQPLPEVPALPEAP
jgi:hypothetical protein